MTNIVWIPSLLAIYLHAMRNAMIIIPHAMVVNPSNIKSLFICYFLMFVEQPISQVSPRRDVQALLPKHCMFSDI